MKFCLFELVQSFLFILLTIFLKMKAKLVHQTHHAEKGDTTRLQKKMESLPQSRIHHMFWLVHLFFLLKFSNWLVLFNSEIKLLFIWTVIYPYLLHSGKLQVAQT